MATEPRCFPCACMARVRGDSVVLFFVVVRVVSAWALEADPAPPPGPPAAEDLPELPVAEAEAEALPGDGVRPPSPSPGLLSVC